MKKSLRLLIVCLAGAMFFANKANAQCNFSNAGVELVSTPYTDPVTGNCMIHFDLYFDLQSNAGGKYVYVHIWPGASYPSLNYANPPMAADLAGSALTFGFFHHTSGLYMLNSYSPDPTIPNFQFTGVSVVKGPGTLPGYDRFEIEGLIISSPIACSVPQTFIADAWESQSAAAQNVHCFSKGLAFYANDPRVQGLLYCGAPRQYAFTITSINTAGLDVSYKVYLDVDRNGVYNSTIDTILVNSGSTSLNAGNGYKFNSGILNYLPYAGQTPYADMPLWIVVKSPSLPNDVFALITNNCIPLPVQFASFTAVRNKGNAELTWVTASETNNKGFVIDRKDGIADWKRVAFVPAFTASGNSDEAHTYTYTDANTSTTVSQYRIGQQDINGKTIYSEIRLVKGLAQEARLLVYPNPSPNGQVNVVLENGMSGAVLQLLDMNGKLVRTWNHAEGNSLSIADLKSGMYVLRAYTGNGNEVISVKILVGR